MKIRPVAAELFRVGRTDVQDEANCCSLQILRTHQKINGRSLGAFQKAIFLSKTGEHWIQKFL
jgi:hypothetical protein